MQPILDVVNVSYAYLGRFPALIDVSFAIDQGECVALLGANGSGKSTMLNVLDALVFPDDGQVHAFGKPLTEAALEDEQFNAAFRSRVGFVFQHAEAQVFSPTVRDEVSFGPLNLGLSSDDVAVRVDEVLVMLAITELADRAPYQLSGGEKKKVAIASVLAMNPAVLLLDEPTAGLDPRTRRWLIDLLIELRESGRTLVVASHDLTTVPTFAERCLVFGEDHRVAGDGPTEEVLADRDLLVAANLADPTP